MKDADAVRNLRNIVAQHKDEDIFLVVSAMGKTTNMLEKALRDFREHDGQLGMEALHLIKVDKYPAIIGAAHGKSIYTQEEQR